MFIAIADKYGQVIGTLNNSRLFTKIDQEYLKNEQATKYRPVVAGVISFYSSNGVFKVENLQFTGTPGSKYKLKFLTDVINMKIPSNQEFY
jgi:hypothetical protein